MGILLQMAWVFPIEPGWVLHVWKPLVCGLLFYVGQCLTFAALARCDVSVATPVLGVKVVFVVLFVSLAGASLPGMRWWVAAGLCSVGILLVSARRGFWREAGHHAWGTLASLGAAACFGLTDALFQIWVPAVGVGAFAPVMFASMAAFTVGHHFLRERSLPEWPPRAARFSAVLGLVLLSLQCATMALAIGFYKDAAGTNIVYGSRAVLGVLLAAAVLRWQQRSKVSALVGSGSASMDTGVFYRRLSGSILVFAAIAIVLF